MVLREGTRNDSLNLKLETETHLFGDWHMVSTCAWESQISVTPIFFKGYNRKFPKKLEVEKSITYKITTLFYFSSRSILFLIYQMIAYITGFLTLNTMDILD